MYRPPKRVITKLAIVGSGAAKALVGPAKIAGKTAITVLTIATLILGFVKYRDDFNKGAQTFNLDIEIPPFEFTTKIEIALDPAQEARIIQAIKGE